MSDPADSRAAMQDAFDRAQAVKKVHEQRLLGMPNVVGVGVGLRQQRGVTVNEVALVVMVRQKKPTGMLAREEVLPAQIDGVPVDVLEVGEIRAE